MLPHFGITGTDGNYIPMFSWTKFFSVDLRLNNEVVIQLHCVKLEKVSDTKTRSLGKKGIIGKDYCEQCYFSLLIGLEVTH